MSDHENKVREATKAVMAQHDNTLRRLADAPASAGPPDARERLDAQLRSIVEGLRAHMVAFYPDHTRITGEHTRLGTYVVGLMKHCDEVAALAAPSPSAGSERERFAYLAAAQVCRAREASILSERGLPGSAQLQRAGEAAKCALAIEAHARAAAPAAGEPEGLFAEVRSTVLWGRINAAGDPIRSDEWIAGEDHALEVLRYTLAALPDLPDPSPAPAQPETAAATLTAWERIDAFCRKRIAGPTATILDDLRTVAAWLHREQEGT